MKVVTITPRAAVEKWGSGDLVIYKSIKDKYKNLIILVTSVNNLATGFTSFCGTVINGNEYFKSGDTINTWNVILFDKFQGTITIQQ